LQEDGFDRAYFSLALSFLFPSAFIFVVVAKGGTRWLDLAAIALPSTRSSIASLSLKFFPASCPTCMTAPPCTDSLFSWRGPWKLTRQKFSPSCVFMAYPREVFCCSPVSFSPLPPSRIIILWRLYMCPSLHSSYFPFSFLASSTGYLGGDGIRTYCLSQYASYRKSTMKHCMQRGSKRLVSWEHS